MNDLLSLIGTFASIGSVPLSIYLFMKSTEANLVRVRREIVKILLYQIGGNRQLSKFELETVINSKLRENKIKEGTIIISEIVEDLVAETISNPLIDDIRKETILENLKDLYNNIGLINACKIIDKDYISNSNNSKKEHQVEENKQQNEEKQKLYFEKMKKRDGSATNLFALISVILAILASLLSNLPNDLNWNGIYGVITKLISSNTPFTNITLGALVSIFSAIFVGILKKFTDRRKDE